MVNCHGIEKIAFYALCVCNELAGIKLVQFAFCALRFYNRLVGIKLVQIAFCALCFYNRLVGTCECWDSQADWSSVMLTDFTQIQRYLVCDNFTLILQPQVAYFDKFNFSFQISHILRNECHNVKWPDEEWSFYGNLYVHPHNASVETRINRCSKPQMILYSDGTCSIVVLITSTTSVYLPVSCH